MIRQAWKILGVLLAVIFTNYEVAASTCRWRGNVPGNTYCTEEPYEADCQSIVTYNLEQCEDRVNRFNHGLKYKYNLVINLFNPNQNPFFEDVSFYIKLTIKDGYLITIPKDVFKMTKLTDITITGNKLRKINFNDFLQMSTLKKIDLAKNMINVIETVVVSSRYSSVKDIDISHNFIKAVPNYFLRRFSELEHLNLSHNMISSIDAHAFMGTEQLQKLKTLDITSNQLFKIGTLFAKLPTLSKLLLDDNFIFTINFTQFFDTQISEISIGQNQIPCEVLASVKYSDFSTKFNSIVTAKTLNYHLENVNGITCQYAANDTSGIFPVFDRYIDLFLKEATENNSKSIDSPVEVASKMKKRLEDFINSSNTSNNTRVTNDIQITTEKTSWPFGVRRKRF